MAKTGEVGTLVAQEGQRALRPQADHSRRPGAPRGNDPDGIPELRSDSVREGHPEILSVFFLEERRGSVGRWAEET